MTQNVRDQIAEATTAAGMAELEPPLKRERLAIHAFLRKAKVICNLSDSACRTLGIESLHGVWKALDRLQDLKYGVAGDQD